MSTIREKSGRWYVVYWAPALKRHVTESLSKFAGFPITTRRMADKAHRQWIRASQAVAAKRTPLTEFFDQYEKFSRTRKTPQTQRVDGRRLAEFERWAQGRGIRHLLQIKRSAVIEYIGSLSCGPTTRNHHLALLKAILNHAVDCELLEANPIARIKPEPNYNKRPTRALTPEEVTIIRESFPEPDRSFALIGLYTGLRRNEVVYLAWDDIGPDVITVRAKPEFGHSPKSARHRGEEVIPISPGLRKVLDVMPRVGRFVFDNGHGRPRYKAPNNWYKRLQRLFREHGIEGNIHCLRHTFIDGLARAGMHPMMLQKIARHSSLTTTMAYTHLTIDDLKRAMDAVVEHQ